MIFRILFTVWATISCLDGFAETISIGVFEQHERYASTAKSYGNAWRILESAAANQDWKIQLQESSWNATIKRLKSHKVDLAFGGYKTPEREQWAIYSLPLGIESAAVFTRLSNPVQRFEDIDFANSVIGVSANSVYAKMASELGFDNIYMVAQRPQLYKMLNQGRLDYLMFGRSAMEYYCAYFAAEKQKNCAKQIGPNFESKAIYALAAKSNPEAQAIINALNKGILAANPNHAKTIADAAQNQLSETSH